jgi:hypothetical protein
VREQLPLWPGEPCSAFAWPFDLACLGVFHQGKGWVLRLAKAPNLVPRGMVLHNNPAITGGVVVVERPASL